MNRTALEPLGRRDLHHEVWRREEELHRLERTLQSGRDACGAHSGVSVMTSESLSLWYGLVRAHALLR